MKSIVKLPVMLTVLGATLFGLAGTTFAAERISDRGRGAYAYSDSYGDQVRSAQEITTRDAAEGN